ncbi:MAG: hypothetical protein COB20_02840 [SAR86 cluster bacterium]|uniref:Calcineurin-like phosphoesterase domain-containing protein n=1 Tax=SAR86 cluster bacterium TaxID=2030880 RepID=A0A2A4XDK7_9GAMM|nr:MAG: hypothetical protein COB20_02840 [SAR86 cluster bacterium]
MSGNKSSYSEARAQDLESTKLRLKETWAKLSTDEQDRLGTILKNNHQFLLNIRDGNYEALPDGFKPFPELLMGHSLLHDDPDGLLNDADTATYVDGDGLVYFGGVDYDQTDPKWSYTLFAWEETKGQTPPFPNNPAQVQIPNITTINLFGDWGGNNAASQAVATCVQPNDFLIHLGDVYYAGTDDSGFIEDNYEGNNFLDIWPGKSKTSFALNSNHDMYAHGTGYFNMTLASPTFASQNGTSYFALYNDVIRIVGLDTAYYDKSQSGMGFMNGNLGPDGVATQAGFLEQQAQLAADSGQTLILMSHHTGLSLDGTTQTDLMAQVVAKLSAMEGKKVIWYWGHEHIAAVYNDIIVAGVQISPRCCGHSCIPWGVATNLENSTVAWYEKEVLGPGSNYFVTNGYAALSIDENGTLTEKFLTQNNAVHWSQSF